MKKKKFKNFKVTTDQATDVINVMFSRLNSKQRSKILNLIDLFIVSDLKISKEDVPWLNKKKKNISDYIHLLDLMRLSYAKLINDSEKQFIKNIH